MTITRHEWLKIEGASNKRKAFPRNEWLDIEGAEGKS